MIDAASGGALGDMTPVEARNLIKKMASNSQQFSARNDATNSSSSAETKNLAGKLDALVNLVTQLAMNQKSASASVARVYGLCSSADHHTDLCPSLQQSRVNEQPEAYAANIYNRPPQQQNQQQQNNYDLSRNKYNPGWKNHPNLRWASPPQQQQPVPPF